MMNRPQETKHFFFTGGTSCRGCGSLLAIKIALDTIYNTTKDAIVLGGGCTAAAGAGAGGGGLGYIGSGMTGIEVAARLRGINKHLVAISGEGQIFEAGFDDFAAYFERGQQGTFIAMDNNGYSSTGNHKTTTTPLKVRTSMFPKGKPTTEKNMAMMMMFGGARYTATAVPAFVDDYRRKIKIALEVKPSLIQVLCPCVTVWGYEPDRMISVSKMAVATGIFPLWEYNDGVFSRTLRVRDRKPVSAYLDLQRRFSHLSDKDVEEIQAHVNTLDESIDGMEMGFRKSLNAEPAVPLPIPERQ